MLSSQQKKKKKRKKLERNKKKKKKKQKRKWFASFKERCNTGEDIETEKRTKSAILKRFAEPCSKWDLK